MGCHNSVIAEDDENQPKVFTDPPEPQRRDDYFSSTEIQNLNQSVEDDLSLLRFEGIGVCGVDDSTDLSDVPQNFKFSAVRR